MRVITSLTMATAASALAVHNPKTGHSTGFRLIAKVTNPSKDLTPSINNWPVTSAHTGAGLAAAVLDSTNPGRIFYENGTHAQVTAYQTTILTDGGTPPAPYGLTVPAPGSQPLPGQEVIGINVGPGTFNTIVSKRGKGPVVVNRLDEGKGTFVACKGEIPYYPGLEFVKVQYVYAGEKLGEGCVGIELVPECAELNELPEGSYSSHEFAVEVKCFDNN